MGEGKVNLLNIMEINIPLPECPQANTYKELMAYLKQLELAVHHAQKSLEYAEKDGIELTEDAFINFNHPSLEEVTKQDGRKENNELLENVSGNYYEELQNIELHLHLV